MLQAKGPARLGVPVTLVRPDGFPTIPVPELPQEEVSVETGLIVRDPEPEERLQSGLVGDPDPGLAPP
jgi:hypothetical protein